MREVIRAFVHTPGAGNGPYYFLSNEGRIAGLLSVASLNFRQIQVYLFSLPCKLEDRILAFVKTIEVLRRRDR